MTRKNKELFREFLSLVKEMAKYLEFEDNSREVQFAHFVFNFPEEFNSLKLLAVKFFFQHQVKGTLSLLEYLVENERSIEMLSGLYEILQASPSPEHRELLEKMDKRLSSLWVPKASELKVLVDLGFTRLKSENGIEVIDSYKAHQLDKPCDNFHTFSYDNLARDFELNPESLLILSKQHIIGIKLYPKFPNLGIPQSINLLTKLKILIIDNESLEKGDYKKILPLDNLPNEIIHLKNLRILYIMNSELKEFPKEFAQISHLRYLYILDSRLRFVPNFTIMFPKLRGLTLEGGPLKKTPNWLFEFARKHYSRRYIQKGVNKEDATVLGFLEILSRPLERAEYNDIWDYNCHGYTTNELGRITDLKLGFWMQSSRNPPFYLLPCFPEEICKLRQLEKLYICNGIYSEEYGFWPPHWKEKADARIPESIRELKSLRYLWTNAKYSKSLKPFLESLEMFETDVFEP